MKKLPIESASYRYIEKSFKEWLHTIGYCSKNVYSMPNLIRELFYYMEGKGITEIKDIDNKIIKEYYQYLKQRTNQRTGGALSNNALNKHIDAIKKFTDYLRQAGRHTLPVIDLRREEPNTKPIQVLTTEEIQALYKAAEGYNEGTRLEALNLRDKAMMSVFYSCGLRANEGRCLDLSDILFERQLIHVRNGKGYKERLVPINKTNLKYIEDYIYNSRPQFIRSNKEEALFISQKGRRMSDQMFNLRLKLLVQRTDDPILQAKAPTLHILRHSIATHLLEAGMKLESVSKFLGHDSLESTQIYTHLMKKEDARL